jgi:UDP-N-acetylglucosamine transferase subunit ALG13
LIFTTIGTQLPFDRLIQGVDRWAKNNPEQHVFAQIGPDGAIPTHIGWERTLTPKTFQELINECSCVVSHAGMGTILSAMELGKPIIVMPRRADLNEHRNDHQLATVEKMGRFDLVHVARDDDELWDCLESAATLKGGRKLSSDASPQLIEALRSFVKDKPDSRLVLEPSRL